jgi:hypothetical protein
VQFPLSISLGSASQNYYDVCAFRFLRQPSRPKPPRPVAKSGRALTVPNCQFLDSGPKLAWQLVRRLKFGS